QHPHLAAAKEDAQEGVAARRPSPSGDGDAAASIASAPDTITGMHPHCHPADRQTRLRTDGRLRPLPPYAVIRPAFHAGYCAPQSVYVAPVYERPVLSFSIEQKETK